MRPRGRRQGFALLVVLLALAAIGVLGAEFFARIRADRRVAVNLRAAGQARWAARAGLARALDALDRRLSEPAGGALQATTGDTLLQPIAFRIDAVEVRVSVLDARGRLSLNHAGPGELRRLLAAIGTAAADAEALTDAILDWRDPDGERRPHGAEAAAYLARRPPSRPKDAAFDAVEELGGVAGVSPAAYRRLAPHLTVAGDGRINVNTATAAVLATLPGVDAAAAAALVEGRGAAPYLNPFDAVAALPASARERVQGDMAAFIERIAFAPRDVEIVVHAGLPGSPVRARLRAVARLEGGTRAALLRVIER